MLLIEGNWVEIANGSNFMRSNNIDSPNNYEINIRIGGDFTRFRLTRHR